MSATILIVDDDAYTLKLFERLFKQKSARLKLASNATEAWRYFREGDFNLILMDQRLPDGRGLDILKEMREERPQQVAMLMTGFAEVTDAIRAVREGLFDYLCKPFESLEALEATIEKALAFDGAHREIDRLREALDQKKITKRLVGQSPVIAEMTTKIRQIAPLNTTVLFEGESGTGKSLIAKYLHDLSPAAQKPFLVVNCGALSESLLESALFGYERGAFTGAIKATTGYFEKADHGTLFLDEIANMSQKMQCSLLQVLQDKTFSRLGSATVRSSDFRLVCATNKRLMNEVEAGRFREDLFYRINVVTIEVPPLRERKGDIILLALFFLEEFNRRFGKEVGPFAPDAIEALNGVLWPGNVRELQHVVERLVALHPGGSISAIHIAQIGQVIQKTKKKQEDKEISSYQSEREVFEADYLRRLLIRAGGNVSEAARISGIPRQNLYVRMKRWGVASPEST